MTTVISHMRALFLGFVFLTLSGGSVFAADYVDKVVDGETGEALLAMLDGSGFLPDGRDNGKYLYVIFTPTCQYCDMLYKNTRDTLDQLQIRWIPFDPSGGLDAVYEKPDAQTLAALMEKGTLPTVKNTERNKRIREYTLGGLIFQLAVGAITDDASRIAFPMLLYGAGDTCFVISGMPPDMTRVINTIPEYKPATKAPTVYAAADAGISIRPSTRDTYINENAETTKAVITSLPLDGAPALAIAREGETQLPVLGVAGDFVVISLDASTPQFYIKDPAFTAKYGKK